MPPNMLVDLYFPIVIIALWLCPWEYVLIGVSIVLLLNPRSQIK